MKNVQLWPHYTDRNVVIVACGLSILAFAAFVGSLIPSPEGAEDFHWLNSLIAVDLLIFVWAGFHMFRPTDYGRKWIVAEPVAVPAVWVLFVVALAIWFNELQAGLRHIQEFLHPAHLIL